MTILHTHRVCPPFVLAIRPRWSRRPMSAVLLHSCDHFFLRQVLPRMSMSAPTRIRTATPSVRGVVQVQPAEESHQRLPTRRPAARSSLQASSCSCGLDGGDHESPCREMSSRSPWWEGPSSATRWRGSLSSRKPTKCVAGTVCAVRPVIMIDRVIWVARRAVARVAARRLRRRVARLRHMPRTRV
jgi:hypothetical protein